MRFRVEHTVRFSVLCPCGWSSGERSRRFYVSMLAWWHAWRSPRCRGAGARWLFGG